MGCIPKKINTQYPYSSRIRHLWSTEYPKTPITTLCYPDSSEKIVMLLVSPVFLATILRQHVLPSATRKQGFPISFSLDVVDRSVAHITTTLRTRE